LVYRSDSLTYEGLYSSVKIAGPELPFNFALDDLMVVREDLANALAPIAEVDICKVIIAGAMHNYVLLWPRVKLDIVNDDEVTLRTVNGEATLIRHLTHPVDSSVGIFRNRHHFGPFVSSKVREVIESFGPTCVKFENVIHLYREDDGRLDGDETIRE
jgi:hypothetical protein